MSTNRNITIVCRNISPQLRRVLTLFLIEVAPLTFCGKLSTIVKERLWNELSTDYKNYEMTMIEFDNRNENGFTISENVSLGNKNTDKLDGITLSTRRMHRKEPWETVLGKSIPVEYSLFKHLLDTAAFAEVIIDHVLSEQQLRIIRKSLGVDEQVCRKIILFASGMHDIGKAHPEWQHNTLGIREGHLSLQDSLPMPEEINKDSERWRHDINSGVFFEKNSVVSNRHLRSFLSEVTASHHGDFARYSKVKDHKDFTISKEWEEAQQKIEKEMLSVLEISEEDFSTYRRSSTRVKGITLITGIVVLADWLSSRSDFINSTADGSSYHQYYRDTKELALRHIEKLGLGKPEWKSGLTWAQIFPHIPVPNDFQKSLVKNHELFQTNGLTLISAPMGIGKTEASLYLAALNGSFSKNSGIWVTLPTQATANALFDRAVEIHERIYSNKENSVALLHGNSSLNEAMENSYHKSKRVFTEDVLNKFENMDDSDKVGFQGQYDSTVFVSDFLVEQKTGGMSSIAISTIDQLINTTTPLKHNMLRWLAVTGKTLILDEVHDFDAYTFALIKKFVEWAGYLDLNIVLMSASLSEKSQQDLIDAYAGGKDTKGVVPENGIPSPSWVHVKNNQENDTLIVERSETIEAQTYSPYEINLIETNAPTESILSIVSDNPDASTLVVAHTVNQAIAFHREISQRYPGEVFLLHSRMTEQQKQGILKKILSYSGKPSPDNARIPHVLVSTQVVQQSMDIDYDVLISILSPLPEFLQRVGRVYRHDQGNRRAKQYIEKPRVYLLVDEEVSRWVDGSTENFPEASIMPYKKWHIVTTFLTIKKYIADGNIKNIKADIAKLFSLYYEVENEYKRKERYEKLFVSAKVSEDSKSDHGDQRSISRPSEFNRNMESLNMTRSYTAKSRLAATTRLIDETKEIVFVRIDHKKVMSIVRGFDDIGNTVNEPFASSLHALRKQVGLSSFTVSGHFYGSHIESARIDQVPDSLKKTQEYVEFVDIEKVENVVFDKNEGLSFGSLPESKYLWT